MAAEQPALDLEVPPELVPGVYANLLGVWHSAYEFMLDFGVFQPPSQRSEAAHIGAFRVTSRIRLPVTLVFDVLRTINDAMSDYEARFGPIEPPSASGTEPE